MQNEDGFPPLEFPHIRPEWYDLWWENQKCPNNQLFIWVRPNRIGPEFSVTSLPRQKADPIVLSLTRMLDILSIRMPTWYV